MRLQILHCFSGSILSLALGSGECLLTAHGLELRPPAKPLWIKRQHGKRVSPFIFVLLLGLLVSVFWPYRKRGPFFSGWCLAVPYKDAAPVGSINFFLLVSRKVPETKPQE